MLCCVMLYCLELNCAVVCVLQCESYAVWCYIMLSYVVLFCALVCGAELLLVRFGAILYRVYVCAVGCGVECYHSVSIQL
jgi:hypothetical protein